jgi:hypothetical protein
MGQRAADELGGSNPRNRRQTRDHATSWNAASRDDAEPPPLTIDQAIYRFSVDEHALTVRVLAIFFGGQHHVCQMLARLLQQP